MVNDRAPENYIGEFIEEEDIVTCQAYSTYSPIKGDIVSLYSSTTTEPPQVVLWTTGRAFGVVGNTPSPGPGLTGPPVFNVIRRGRVKLIAYGSISAGAQITAHACTANTNGNTVEPVTASDGASNFGVCLQSASSGDSVLFSIGRLS